MSYQSLINLNDCRVTRNTNVLLESIQIVAAPVINRQPAEEVYLSISISGCTTGSGVVVVNGIISGIPDSETFSFTQNSPKIGTKGFTSITSITTVGFVGEAIVGTIEIKAITQTNIPINQEIKIFAAMPAWVDFHRGGIQVILPGGVIQTVSKLFTEYNSLTSIRENDIVYYKNVRYRMKSIEPVNTRSATPHHLEVILEKLKAS